MSLTAVIFTFYEPAVIGAALVALGVFAITLILAHRRRNTVRAGVLLGIAWFFLTLFSLQAYLGIRVGSIEVVSYEASEN